MFIFFMSMFSKMRITVLGSCRQHSLQNKYSLTSIQEELSYPHYTKEILEVIKNEFTNQKISNWELLSDEERNKQLMWIENEYYDKKGYDNEAVPQPEMTEEPMGMEEQSVNNVITPRRARLIRMTPPHEASQDEGPMQTG